MPNVITSDESLTDLFESWNLKQEKTPLTFKDDPVVLACGAHRLKSYPDLDDIVPTIEDRILGAAVRKHFMDKLVIQKLKGGTISAFREKLGAFLVENRPIYKDEIGMLYHLPYFYFEDQERESLITSTSAVEELPPISKTVSLKPYTILTLKRRSGAIKQYWWTDENNSPYCLSIRETSENQSLYKSIWDFSSIKVEAVMYVKPFHSTDRFHYKLTNAKLVGVNNG